jgi:polar amino acid transport system ATP-binding protein
MSMLRAANVHKRYGDLEVLRGVTLDVDPGQVKVLIGPSGSGKSTLLRCLALLEEPESGDVALEGRRPAPGEVGMVFQRFNLFQNMTALGNVMSGLVTVRGLPKNEARDQALAFLEKVGLAEKAAQYPEELVREVLDVMESLAREGMTMVVVSHELRFAHSVASSVLMMDEGRIVEEAPPGEFFSSPKQERTKRFLSLVE